MPSSSPVFSTYVEWESKPRKWSKRWLELREQGLWLSKKDNVITFLRYRLDGRDNVFLPQGKDEIFLCSLANFDAYVVTRTHKPPKPYVFAAKSTDSLSFFENAADYVHVFCCSEKDGKKWLANILLARVSDDLVTTDLCLDLFSSPTLSIRSVTRSRLERRPPLEHQANLFRTRAHGKARAALNSRWWILRLVQRHQQLHSRTLLNQGHCFPGDNRPAQQHYIYHYHLCHTSPCTARTLLYIP
jgi:hypothetical protein